MSDSSLLVADTPMERWYKMKGLKIILFDIETAPILGYTWGLYETDVLDIVRPSYLLCFAWKELNRGSTQIASLRQFAPKGKNNDGEEKLVKKLWEVLNDADVVIAHNGDKFDVKKANGFFMRWGLTPPKPFKTVDTLKEYKKVAKEDSHKLDALGRTLQLGRKVRTGGFNLWLDCMNGNVKAWQRMEKYCKGDVRLLEDVYNKLLPWMKAHPNISIYLGRPACPRCGANAMQSRGTRTTNTGEIPRYQCQVCKGWCSGKWEKGEKPETAEYRLP